MLKKTLKKARTAAYAFVAPLYSKKSTVTSDDAVKNLESCSARPTGRAVAKNECLTPTCDLQIIIPAYNVEAYLEDCMESILSQKTRYSFHVVLIEDGATDRTPAIADQYQDRDNVTVIHQKNRGFSGARNRGLQTLFGKYIMFVDSDDMLVPGAIEALLSAAFEGDCDIVEGGAYWLRGKNRGIHYSHPKTKHFPTALGIFHGEPWAKVYKQSCFANIVYPEGFWYEDSILSFLIYPFPMRVCVVNAMTYLHRVNPKGITVSAKGRPKSVDSYWITESLLKESLALGVAFDHAFFKKFLHQLRLNQVRMQALPETVQQSAFVLSCDLMHRYFPEDLIRQHKGSNLVKALCQKDWGMFKVCCKY